MFTIEHEFDHTTVTLIDEGDGSPLAGDVTIAIFQDRVSLVQADPDSDALARITLSMPQLADLAAALDLPEGSYRRPR